MSVEVERLTITVGGDVMVYMADIAESRLEEFQKTFGEKYHSWGSIHAVCRGFLDWYSTTPVWQVLKCRRCGLRVQFPRSIQTVQDLRDHLKKGGVYAGRL